MTATPYIAKFAWPSTKNVVSYCCGSIASDCFSDKEASHLMQYPEISHYTRTHTKPHPSKHRRCCLSQLVLNASETGCSISAFTHTLTRALALLSGRWIISWCFLAGGGAHRRERPAKLFCHFFVMSYGTPPPVLLYDTAAGSFSPRLSSCIHGHHSAGPPLLCWGETPNNHPEPLALTIWLYRQTPTKTERKRERGAMKKI